MSASKDNSEGVWFSVAALAEISVCGHLIHLIRIMWNIHFPGDFLQVFLEAAVGTVAF